MKITRGKIPGAKKVVIYGPEGIGKSTFASQFPDPLFIDTEGSTKEMDVARTEKPSSWDMLLSQVDEVVHDPSICRTLVVDTVDWAEQLCIESICSKHQKDGLESFGYGNGYVYVKEEFGRFLNHLSDVVEAGVNVVLTAHAQLRKFEQPDELGAYDRWELKLGKKTSSQTAPLVKEWSDMLLFANYKTFSVATDEKGKKHKAQGGERVMYTLHHPCWDAKNRYGLPGECPLTYEVIRDIIEPTGSASVSTSTVATKPSPDTATRSSESPVTQDKKPVAPAEKLREAAADNVVGPMAQTELPINKPEPELSKISVKLDERIPKALRDLMEADGICDWDVENFVVAEGYIPYGTKIWDFDSMNPGIIDGFLVAKWTSVVCPAIREMKEKQEVPFN